MKAEKKEKPLYIKVSEDILEKYRYLEYYSPLPGERELCEIFHTSRPTIRKAIDVLEKMGKSSVCRERERFLSVIRRILHNETNSVIE